VLPQLAQRYRVLAPDLRGSGESTAGEGPATMAKHAADIDRLCAAAGVNKAVFVGISMGGYVLFEFWRRHAARVAGLVFCDTRATADTPEGRAARLKSVTTAWSGGVRCRHGAEAPWRDDAQEPSRRGARRDGHPE
jgi:pimeloyl-ACP methyl ester carboxylesterase